MGRLGIGPVFRGIVGGGGRLGGRGGFHVGRWGRLLSIGMEVALLEGKVVLEDLVLALEGPVTLELESMADFHVVRWQR